MKTVKTTYERNNNGANTKSTKMIQINNNKIEESKKEKQRKATIWIPKQHCPPEQPIGGVGMDVVC